ncbi:hypothetical protein [Lysinibacter cavernae]|uniref:Uncharacterized protein n=1 Tax=Lysinibacter cavernae TaxID=1640652 RepID=A0A7X5TSL4_9MICO|nr:hypothetical protein [Lysinibacter cavernae]NIH52554.1 hypothetical protein [Lysinibacter cavernae]
MGYSAATTDPFESLRRQREAESIATREALSAGGTRSFQSVAKLSAQMAAMEEVILSIPHSVVGFGQGNNYALREGWNTVANVTILRPPGKNRLSIMAIGTGSATNVRELSFPTVVSRVIISGTAGMESSASTRPFSDRTMFVCDSSFGMDVSNPAASISVAFQIGWSAGYGDFPARSDSVAQLTAQATFTRT